MDLWKILSELILVLLLTLHLSWRKENYLFLHFLVENLAFFANQAQNKYFWWKCSFVLAENEQRIRAGIAGMETVGAGDRSRRGRAALGSSPATNPSLLAVPQHWSQAFHPVQTSFPLVTDWQSPKSNLSLWLFSWSSKAFSSSLQLWKSSGESGNM